MPPSREDARAALNREHWNRTIDAQNIEGGGDVAPETALALYNSADVRAALDRLEPLRGRRVLALGDALGLSAVLLARRGATVVVADISLPRLHEGRRLAARLGLGGAISFVASAAENLPFSQGSFDRVLTKSVLIHTDLTRSLPAVRDVLVPGARGVFIEPLRRNPLVNLYRRLLAPRVWASITHYFGAREERELSRAFGAANVRRRRMYFIAFLASVFAFALRSPTMFRLAEAALLAFDAVLLSVAPPLRARCWFAIYEVRIPRARR